MYIYLMSLFFAISVLGFSQTLVTIPNAIPTIIPAPTATAVPARTDFHYGTLMGHNPPEVMENSGMTYSKRFNRLYLINDSGNDNFFYVTDLKGKLIEKVLVRRAINVDWEGITYAPCGMGFCLYIGDLGDNGEDTKLHHIYIVTELKNFNKSAALRTDITFSYEGGLPHNAESIAVHPVSGDIFIATKNLVAGPTTIYKIARTAFANRLKATVIAKKVGEINYLELNSGMTAKDTITTDMAFSPSGKRFLLLTDQGLKVWEFNLDLSKFKFFKKGDLLKKFQIISIDSLGQEESACYLNENEFLYSSEGPQSPIVKIKIRK